MSYLLERHLTTARDLIAMARTATASRTPERMRAAKALLDGADEEIRCARLGLCLECPLEYSKAVKAGRVQATKGGQS